MGSGFQELTEKLGKLQRNETQMTERQKIIYAEQLKALKHKIAGLATGIAKDFILGGIRLLKQDQEEFIAQMKTIIDQEVAAGAMKKASRVLFTTYDPEKFLEALVPFRHRVWYEGYGPYWCKHSRTFSQQEITENGYGEYTAYNEIIKAWYLGKHRTWIFQDGRSFTLMLPPTMELVNQEYQQEKERMEKEYGKDSNQHGKSGNDGQTATGQKV